MLWPLLRGQTLSEVATYQSYVYPWAGSATSTHGTASTITHWDQLESFYPWQVYMSRTLHAHQLPLWNPYEFGGIPFFANATNGLLYPPRLLFSLTVSPVRVHDLLALSHMFGAGVAMYLMLAWFNRSWIASVFGAAAWMTSSFLLAWLALEHFLIIAVWLPIAILLVDYTLRRRSLLGALGFTTVLTLLYLGGNALFVELAFLTIGAFAATTIWGEVAALRRDGGAHIFRPLTWGAPVLVLSGIAVIGLGAVQLIPNLELLSLTARSGLTYAQAADFALPFALLRDIFLPPRQPAAPDFVHTLYHEALFVGTPTALLGLVGLISRARFARFAAILAVVVVLVMLRTPVTHLLYVLVPGFNSLKPLARASFLLCFAVAALGAFGMDRVSRLLVGRWPGRRSLALVAVGACACTLIVVIQARQLAHADDLRYQEPAPAAMFPTTPLIEKLQSLGSPRFLPLVRMLRGSTPMIFPIPSAAGYESLIPSRVARFWEVVGGASPAGAEASSLNSAYYPQYAPDGIRYDLLPRAGVSYLAMMPGTAPPAAGSASLHGAPEPELAYDDTDGRLFHLAGATGIVALLDSCQSVTTEAAALRTFTNNRFDAGRSLLLEQPVASLAPYCKGDGAAQGTARITSSGVNTLVAKATLRRPAMLLIRMNAYPGWHATVDGKDTKLVDADYLFQAVPLTAGTHEVRLSFEPRSVRIGAAISLASFGLVLGAFVVLLLRRRRRRA